MAAPACTADPREDIGHGVTIERRYIDGVLVGIAYWHPDGKDGVCEGYIFPKQTIAGVVDGWDFVSEHPLHVEPSLRCRVCGHHGWIRGGAWVPA